MVGHQTPLRELLYSALCILGRLSHDHDNIAHKPEPTQSIVWSLVLLCSDCFLNLILHASPGTFASIAMLLHVTLDARAVQVSVMGSRGLGRTGRAVFLLTSDCGIECIGY